MKKIAALCFLCLVLVSSPSPAKKPVPKEYKAPSDIAAVLAWAAIEVEAELSKKIHYKSSLLAACSACGYGSLVGKEYHAMIRNVKFDTSIYSLPVLARHLSMDDLSKSTKLFYKYIVGDTSHHLFIRRHIGMRLAFKTSLEAMGANRAAFCDDALRHLNKLLKEESPFNMKEPTKK